MKKVILSLAVVLGLSANAQNNDSIYDVYKSIAVPESSFEMGDIIELEDNILCMVEDGSTIGYKKAIGYASLWVKKFGGDFFEPDIDNTFLVSYVDNLFDYSSVATSCQVRSSEVDMVWLFDGYKVAFKVNDNVCAVFIVKTK